MKKFKVVMLGINEFCDIVMDYCFTRKEALELKNKCEQKDGIHYFEVKEVK